MQVSDLNVRVITRLKPPSRVLSHSQNRNHLELHHSGWCNFPKQIRFLAHQVISTEKYSLTIFQDEYYKRKKVVATAPSLN